MDCSTLQTILTAVSALAALGALIFAWLTVRAAGRQRREERLRSLASLVAELGQALYLAMQASEEHRELFVPLLQLRLAYAIGARRDLPRTLALTLLTREDMAMNRQRQEEVNGMVKAALEEIAEEIAELPQP